MWDYRLLEALDAIASERSFVKAASRLHITQSAISQRIRQLESSMGQPVIIRSPVIKPTSVGGHLITHYRQICMMEHALQKKWSMKKGESEFQPIAIALNTESLSTWCIDSVSSFLRKERIVLELFIDDQDRTIDMLRKGKVWGCVTSVAEPPMGCQSAYLGRMIYFLVSTPEFKKLYFSKGVNAKTLLKAPAAIYGEFDRMNMDYLRACFKGHHRGKQVCHFVPSPEGLVKFALDGLAFVLLPSISIQRYLKDGRLVSLLPSQPFKLDLYWQTLEFQTEETRRLSESIVKHAMASIA